MILQTLTVVFVVLKLVGVIAWPWHWVLAPILVPFLLMFGALGFLAACLIIFEIIEFSI